MGKVSDFFFRNLIEKWSVVLQKNRSKNWNPPNMLRLLFLISTSKFLWNFGFAEWFCGSQLGFWVVLDFT